MEEKPKRDGTAVILLIISLVLCLVSVIGASFLQTAGGRTKVTNLTIETDQGTLSLQMFKPRTATVEHPAPAVRSVLILTMFLVHKIYISVASNSFNYNRIGGTHGWVNPLIVSLFTGLPAIIMLSVQYGTYFTTKHMAWMQSSFSGGGNPPMYILWLFPLVVVLPATTFMSRLIYKVTRNPYLAGIINAIVVVLFAAMNTRTNIL